MEDSNFYHEPKEVKMYRLIIKSNEFHDTEQDIVADTKEEAVEIAFEEMKGEFDRDFLSAHINEI